MDYQKKDESQEAVARNRPIGLQGVSPDTVQQFFAGHRHDGSAMGGQILYGPYFISDSANGHTYALKSTNGALSLVLVK